MSQGGDCPGAPPTGEGTRPVGRRSTSRRVDIPELKRRYSIERALGLPEGSLRPGDPVQCPDASHPDDAPSAQIGRNGDIVWCHVCCCPGDKPWDVIKLYQMLRAGGRSLSFGETIREMAAEVGMSSPPSRSRRRGSEKATTADPIVAEYIYVNENGADLFRVTRHEAPGKKKTFCQWHRDGDGEWVSGLGGIKPVVYLLPDNYIHPSLTTTLPHRGQSVDSP